MLSVQISIASLFQIIGSLIPLALGVIAFSGGGRYVSNRFLGIFLILFSMHVAVFSFSGPVFLKTKPFLLVALDGIPFLYGPLFYFYVRSFLRQEQTWKRKGLLHFLPGFGDMIFYLLIFLTAGEEYVRIGIEKAFEGHPYWYVPLLDLLKTISGISYSLAIVLLLRKHRKLLKKWAAYRVHQKWIGTVIVGFIGTWAVVLLMQLYLLLLGYAPTAMTMHTIVNSFAFILFSSIITVFSLRYPAILRPKEARQEIRRNLNLSAEEIEIIRRKLIAKTEEKYFSDPDISLSSTARAMGVHPNVLSFVINDSFDVGFKEYVNEVRMQEFLEKAGREALETSTILGLAMEAGFPSKSTFNRVFKDTFHVSPREYLKNKSHFS